MSGSSSMSILVIADDLTGACDAAAPFAARGRDVRLVPTWPDDLTGLDEVWDVLVVNTQSRHIEPTVAAGRVSGLMQHVNRTDLRIVKKTDSALRGNIAAELDALAQQLGLVLYAPAMPGSGRTVCDGVLYIEGVPVADSHFGRDPHAPVTESSIVRVLQHGAKTKVRHVGLRELRETMAICDATRGIVVIDGTETSDLQRAAEWSKHANCAATAGPAGIIEQVAEQHGDLTDDPLVLHAPFLVVCGSLTPRARRQVEHGLGCGYDGFEIEANAQPSAQLDAIGHSLGASKSVVLHAPVPAAPPSVDSCRALELSFALTVDRLLQSDARFTLVIFGGETAHRIVTECGIDRARVLRPLSPGVNLLRTEARGRAVELITKSGDFGAESLLEDLLTCSSA